MKKFALMVTVLAVAAVVAQATPTVTLTVTTSSNGKWFVFASDTLADNGGICSFDLNVMATGGTTILTSTMKAPALLDLDTDDDNYGNKCGFGSEFDSNGTISGGNSLDIIGGQGTAYGDSSNADKDWLVLQGIGQTAGSKYSAENNQLIGSWTAPIELARGTFSGAGTFTVNAIGNVLATANWAGPGNVVAANWVPEPATMALLVIGGFAALRRRR